MHFLLSNFLHILCFLCLINNVVTVCDSRTGPPGGIDCLKIDRYNKNQWGTCLTDAYIRQKSGNQHQCVDQSRTYCYYQCMLELYDINSGTVNDICACNDSSIISTTQRGPTTSGLPIDCFSPDGSSCNWYIDCLERRYPCQGTSAGYALEYATKFCNLYTDRKDKFSSNGQRWIDAVRKCLQVELVPLIRPFQNANCSTIRDKAFASHTPCYLNPSSSAPSLCDLPALDWLRVFWTIKSAFIASKSIALASLQGAYETFKSCKIDPVINQLEPYYQQLQLTIDIIEDTWKNPAEIVKEELNAIAANIIDKINEMILKFPQIDFGVYGYFMIFSTQRSNSGHQQIIIEFLLADLNAINNDTFVPSENTTNPQLAAAARKFENALVNGDLNIQTDNGTFYVSKSSHCADMDCEITSGEVVAPPYVPKNGANCHKHNFFSVIFVFSLVLAYL